MPQLPYQFLNWNEIALHSYQLTKWLIEHKPEFLSDLAKLLEARISDNSLRN
jgi:hypothetical protein